MSNTDHDHDEMGSNYCPVCGEELNNIVDTIEKYVEETDKDIDEILVARTVAEDINGCLEEKENFLTAAVDKVDAPVNYVVDYTEDNILNSQITILVERSTFRRVYQFTEEELKEEVKDNE